jgi:hypothetical protein
MLETSPIAVYPELGLRSSPPPLLLALPVSFATPRPQKRVRSVPLRQMVASPESPGRLAAVQREPAALWLNVSPNQVAKRLASTPIRFSTKLILTKSSFLQKLPQNKSSQTGP